MRIKLLSEIVVVEVDQEEEWVYIRQVIISVRQIGRLIVTNQSILVLVEVQLELPVVEELDRDLVISIVQEVVILEEVDPRIVVVEEVRQVIVVIPEILVVNGDRVWLEEEVEENQFRKEMPESNIILTIL